jgi:hypothetical protein
MQVAGLATVSMKDHLFRPPLSIGCIIHLINQDDVRVQRTRCLLRKALITLVANQGYAHVTTRTIIRRARVDESNAFCLLARSKA